MPLERTVRRLNNTCMEPAVIPVSRGAPLDIHFTTRLAISLYFSGVGGCEKDISISLTKFPRGEFMKVQVHNLLPDRIKMVSAFKKTAYPA